MTIWYGIWPTRSEPGEPVGATITDVGNLGTALVSGLIGLVVSAIGTYLGIHWKIRKDLEAKYDDSLRGLRLEAYRELWQVTKPLAAFARVDNPSRDDLEALSVALRDWYFDKGGLYLSEETRDACIALQRAVRVVVASDRWEDPSVERVDDTTFDHLREIASRLRSRMTYDVGTRRPFSLEEKREGTDDWQAAKPTNLPTDATPDERWIFQRWSASRSSKPSE
jgi:hypothetical protein